jgi:hypothetical protein
MPLSRVFIVWPFKVQQYLRARGVINSYVAGGMLPNLT